MNTKVNLPTVEIPRTVVYNTSDGTKQTIKVMASNRFDAKYKALKEHKVPLKSMLYVL